MAASTPARAADRNLLFGILALQMDFIGRDGLILLDISSAPQVALQTGVTPIPLLCVAVMPVDSIASLVDRLRQTDVLEAVQLEEVTLTLQTRFADPHDLVKELIGRGWLTAYQAEQILKDPTPALVLGAYVLLDRLGQGGVGQVFKARHRVLNRLVALKVIGKKRLTSDVAIDRFRREAQAVARLTHPNIVYVYDFDQVNQTHFLVMQLIEGSDLQKRVTERGPLPVEEARNFIRQAALGLQHAHEAGLVHRDIKPANLLLTSRGQEVKILDFGFALLRSWDAHTKAPHEPKAAPSAP